MQILLSKSLPDDKEHHVYRLINMSSTKIARGLFYMADISDFDAKYTVTGFPKDFCQSCKP